MSTYIIGDVHGCYDQFVCLLNKIDYNSQKDKIVLTGDLVNRGPESLAFLITLLEIKILLQYWEITIFICFI